MLSQFRRGRHMGGMARAKVKRRPEVVPLPVYPVKERDLPVVPGPDGLTEEPDPGEVPLLGEGQFTELAQPLPAVLAHRLKQPIARWAAVAQLALQDGLVH